MATKKASPKHSPENDEACGCKVPIVGRKAQGVDPEIKASNLRRLSRIEGQVRGIQRMVEEDRYCPDILMQVSSAQEALRAVARALMRNHLAHCVNHTIHTGSEEDKQAIYNELLEMIYKNAR